MWLYLMHAKSQALDIFLKFKLLVENQLGHKIKNIQSDNAREFITILQHTIYFVFLVAHVFLSLDLIMNTSLTLNLTYVFFLVML